MKKTFGQHFLFDPSILGRIIKCSNLTSEDTVVEIGAGLGTLTKLLSENAGRVISIEIDKRLIERLEAKVSGRENIEIVRGDAMKYPYNKIEGKFRVIANIPYYITTPLIFNLLSFKDKVKSMTLLNGRVRAVSVSASLCCSN